MKVVSSAVGVRPPKANLRPYPESLEEGAEGIVTQPGARKHSLMVVWAPFLPVVPDMQLVRRAAALAEQEALRGYDAVHLAGALEAQVDVFVCSDTNLVRAARNCGLRVIDTRI